jgi:hypothetical protein
MSSTAKELENGSLHKAFFFLFKSELKGKNILSYSDVTQWTFLSFFSPYIRVKNNQRKS